MNVAALFLSSRLSSIWTLVVTLITALTLTGCVNVATQGEWPSNIPSKDYLYQYYQQEDTAHQKVLSYEKYTVWVHRFYYGSPWYPSGWVESSADFSQSLHTAKEQAIAEEALYQIGYLVGPEWAKNYRFRVINSKNLNTWGNTLNRSIVENNQLATLEEILSDVKGLLAGNIVAEDIQLTRYFPPEVNDDPFKF